MSLWFLFEKLSWLNNTWTLEDAVSDAVDEMCLRGYDPEDCLIQTHFHFYNGLWKSAKIKNSTDGHLKIHDVDVVANENIPKYTLVVVSPEHYPENSDAILFKRYYG